MPSAGGMISFRAPSAQTRSCSSLFQENLPMFRLEERRAVVTGGASGIGLAIGDLFAASGAEVVLLDLNAERVSIAAKEIVGKRKSVVTGYGCDVSNEESVRNAFERITSTSSGAIDVLVNCAGIAHVGNLITTSPADLDKLYAVNVRGTYLAMRAALPVMLSAGKGTILNMASIAATAGLSDRFAYSMTKGAVLSMTLSVAKDYIAKGIRCNCISPARVHTPFVDGFLAKNYPGREAEQMQLLEESQPIGRMALPAEIAMLALYLCSEQASFITGADYPIDGGFFNLR
jgi:2-keto-3-deoxy-L-fuconate dehydrogenase